MISFALLRFGTVQVKVDLMLQLLLELRGNLGTAMALIIKLKLVPRCKTKPFAKRRKVFQEAKKSGPEILKILTTTGRSGMLKASP